VKLSVVFFPQVPELVAQGDLPPLACLFQKPVFFPAYDLRQLERFGQMVTLISISSRIFRFSTFGVFFFFGSSALPFTVFILFNNLMLLIPAARATYFYII
jgi:hypothetical protein